MKKRGLLGLLLACMVMLGAGMTVFAADVKVIDCNDGFNGVVAKHVDKLVVSGGESFQIILVKGMPTGGGITINGVPGYDRTSSPDNYTHTIVIRGDSSKKYILSGYSCDDSLGVSVGIYEFWFKEYTEGKPAGQQPQPASQPTGQQPQSQPVEEPGEQLGGG